MHRNTNFIVTALSLLFPLLTHGIPDPIICEDSLDGTSSHFNSNNVPCLLGCGAPEPVATGSLLPGSVNVTDIPYCRLNCVHRDSASPAQSSAAPDCNSRCENGNGATPENLGWCMYWCVDGYSDLVGKTTCIPSLVYGDLVTSTIGGGDVVTFRPFSNPSQWQSWYQTQTVLPKSSGSAFVATPTPGHTVTGPSSSSTTEYSAPFRASPGTQGSQTSALTTGSESVLSTVTGEQVVESSTVASTTSATGAVSRLSYEGFLGAVSILIMAALL
ncbi:uncharacterized protein F4822DRAFT_395623 [Hypoxylon trugodes]|uniref:uncharacterized protein n=1 Tax=Hypoxylon trugodes TaxID=326681 RepID=UPI00218F0E28|nr:uncharacterized protein F4822DRAFT_395623 [Hypoxylon trugodes]KAI1391123.1 hypothetical protein F4822DRAFT_395623 [Hypoxylon trugodes]